ncbi:MAG TPA: pitrilysin family protein [Blastocatellia bacterium]|nr:pitrilysin family protein [Blastocatellia bacterium]
MTTVNNAEAGPHIFDITHGVERTRLSNGLTVLTKEIHAKPVVSSIIWYRVGSRNEEPGQTGKSHFLEHMLFKGTDRFAKGEIDLITLQNGGANNAFTDTDFTAYYFNFASDRWQVALEIEANRMVNNTFAPDEYESEKQVVEEELRIGLDGPWEALDQAVWAAAYRQHPYHNPVIGWLEDLERATREEMEAYYHQWYHPRNATLVIVGDIRAGETLGRVQELFGPIPSGPEPKPMPIREQPQRGERRVTVRKQTEVERLQIGFHTPEVTHPDAYVAQMLDTILGTGKTSRLYRRLEEHDQSVTHFSVDYHDRIDPTLFTIRAEIKPDHGLAEVERAVEEELDRLRQSPVSDEELRRARQLIKARFVLGNEQASNQAITLGYYETINRYEYLSDFFTKIDEVTAAEVQRVARHYLVTDNRTVGWLVDEN